MTNWSTELDKVTEQAAAMFGKLPDEQLNWKLNANTWSIAQNIDHLIVVNETYFPILSSLKEGTYTPPFISRIGFLVSFFGTTVLSAVKPDRKKKMKTFPMWEPATSKISSDILNRFEIHQNLLKAEIDGAKELIERGTIISSPANKNIVYKLETAFDIIVSHEQRHLEQAKEVLELL